MQFVVYLMYSGEDMRGHPFTQSQGQVHVPCRDDTRRQIMAIATQLQIAAVN